MRYYIAMIVLLIAAMGYWYWPKPKKKDVIAGFFPDVPRAINAERQTGLYGVWCRLDDGPWYKSDKNGTCWGHDAPNFGEIK